MVKVIPSAFGLINWKEKLVVNDCTFTGVVKNTLDASLEPPFVSSSCDAAWFQLAFPFNCKPVVDVNPLEKLITAGLVLAVTVRVAVLLVTGPTPLLTTTSNVDPLLLLVVAGVV